MNPANSQPVTHNTVARLSGRTLQVARLLWLAVCVSATVAFLIALPFRFDKLTHPSATNLANMLAFGITPLQFARYILFWEIVIGASYAVVGFLIFYRSRDESIALLASLMLIVFGLGNGTITPTMRSLLGLHPAVELLQHTFEFLAWLSFALFFYIFPNGHFVPKWTRWAAALWLPICIVWNYAGDSPYAPLNWSPVLFVPVIGFFWASFLFSQVYRYRRVSSAIERQQTKWVVYAVTMFILLMLAIALIGLFIPGYNLLSEEQPTVQSFAYMFWQWLTSPLVAALPIAIAFSILRYRLWDIDILINRTLVYGSLTAIVVGIYVLIVGGFGYLFQSDDFILSLLVTGLIAVIFQPLRERLQRAVDRLLYGERDNPISVLTKLGERLEATVAPESTLPTIAESISQALRLPYVAILLKEGTEFSLAADCGTRPAGLSLSKPASFLTCERIPLNYQTEPIGQILLSHRAGEDSFNADEKSLLQNIAHQVSVAAYAVQLTRDLQRSRERLVTAREEERRRLRRDLHDGLGPALASLTLKLDAARNQLKQNPDEADSLLVELKSQTQSAIADIRRLVYNLRPPALDELGLFSAIQQYASNVTRPDFVARVERDGEFPKLPAAVEVAAYRIVCEAITNAAKHSHATECLVKLTFNGAFHIDVQDNGAGLPKGAHAGVGMLSMRERAAELGGTFEIQSSSNGLHISAQLPCEVDDDR